MTSNYSSHRSPRPKWSIERISGLSTAEVKALRKNAQAYSDAEIIERCDQVLAVRARSMPRPRHRAVNAGAKASELKIQQNASRTVRNLIEALPSANLVPNAAKRSSIQTQPIQTCGDLWKIYVSCGLSSQESSDPDTALGRFCASGHPLFDLDAVHRKQGNPDWIKRELSLHLPRFLHRRTEMIARAYKMFIAAGISDIALTELKPVGPMKLFADLASSRENDRELLTSGTFSATLDPAPYYGIGPKQLRNILVNSGLAVNVLPLDSRWMHFLENAVDAENVDLQRKHHYLAIEDLVRKSLVDAQNARTDILNLGVLDAIVFASQSTQGFDLPGWAAN